MSGTTDHPPPEPATSASKADIPTCVPSAYFGGVPAVKDVEKPGGKEILYVPLPAEEPADASYERLNIRVIILPCTAYLP